MIRTALIAFAALAAAGVASAETGPAAQAVAAKGRDLSTAEGARAFYRDLARAAADVCGGAPTTGGIAAFDRFDDCYDRTLREAVAKTNAPLVTALLKGGAPPVRVADR